MAAAAKYLIKGRNKIVVNVTGIFDTADETETVIIDVSTLVGPDGTAPTSVRIDEVTWAVGAGFDYVLLEWDATTSDVIDYFQGQGYMDFRPYGGKHDPKSSGTTGDIVLSTAGGAAGDTYSFLIAATLQD
jgi:hypothetical protein